MASNKTRFSLIPEKQHGRSFAICKRQYFVCKEFAETFKIACLEEKNLFFRFKDLSSVALC